jgi:hypothetical protein
MIIMIKQMHLYEGMRFELELVDANTVNGVAKCPCSREKARNKSSEWEGSFYRGCCEQDAESCTISASEHSGIT